jgi:hypothetical protein
MTAIMAARQHVTLVAPLTTCEVFQLLLEADKYPCVGNEDVPIAIAMTRDALEKARMAVLSPDDPLEFARWLRELQRPDLTSKEQEEITWALRDYFEPENR